MTPSPSLRPPAVPPAPDAGGVAEQAAADHDLHMVKAILDGVDEFGKVLPQESDLPPQAQRLQDLLAELYGLLDMDYADRNAVLALSTPTEG